MVELKKWTSITHVTFTCPECNHEHDLDVLETGNQAPLSTEDTYKCDSCGKLIEFDMEDTNANE